MLLKSQCFIIKRFIAYTPSRFISHTPSIVEVAKQDYYYPCAGGKTTTTQCRGQDYIAYTPSIVKVAKQDYYYPCVQGKAVVILIVCKIIHMHETKVN